MNKYKECVADLYLSWRNEFLTIERFAEYYELEIKEAEKLIIVGRNFQNQRAEAVRRKERWSVNERT